MIRRLDEGGRAQFLAAARGKGYFGDVLPVHLAVFGTANPLMRFYFAEPCAAMQLRGQGALVCGDYDADEAGAFLRMQGITRVTASGAPPEGFCERQTLCHMVFSESPSPAPLRPDIPALTLDETPSPKEITDFLMRNESDPCAWDNFYSELCTKLNRGAALVWAVRQAGEIAATAGAYALSPSCAYLAGVETREDLRGRGLGGWLTAALTAKLAAGGRRVTLTCRTDRLHFYEAIGYTREASLTRYALADE